MTSPLFEALIALVQNNEHAESGGMVSYQKGSPTWQLWRDAEATIHDACVDTAQPASAPEWVMLTDDEITAVVHKQTVTVLMSDYVFARNLQAAFITKQGAKHG